PKCGGAGQIRAVSRSIFGQFVNIRTCPRCNGEGRVIERFCSVCGGEGRVKAESTLSIEVPPGVSTGNYLTMKGEGNTGIRGGSPGDIIVIFEEKEHKYFVRRGNDILLDLIISFSQAALGDKVEIPTLKGRANLHIPSGIQSGKVLRMKGKGIPDLRTGQIGDQLVRIKLWTPTKLSERQKELFKELSKYDGSMHPSRNGKGLFAKVKDVFS
ncbi:MAG: DnaJ C-terminal domain-containing protein, partial [Fidelibacterota bacterium]